MITLKVVLKNRENKEGKKLIQIRKTTPIDVIENGKKKKKSQLIVKGIGISIFEKDFLPSKQRVRVTAENATLINETIEKFIDEMSKGEVSNITDDNSFITYWENHIIQLKKEGGIANAKRLNSSFNNFKSFLNGADISFKNITRELMVDYYGFIKIKYSNNNTRTMEIKKIKVIVNKALKADKILINPFQNFEKMKKDEVKNKSLSKQQFDIIKNAKGLSKSSAKARNLWLSSFYLQGMRIGDILSTLRFSNLRNISTVNYTMRKSKSEMCIPLSSDLLTLIIEANDGRYELETKTPIDQLKEMVAKYPNDFVYPYLVAGVDDKTSTNKKGETISAAENILSHIGTFTSLNNDRLEQLVKDLDLKVDLKNHTSRHTYAKLLLNSGIGGLYELSKSMGHHSLTVTESYIKSLSDEEALDRNTKFFMSLNAKKKLPTEASLTSTVKEIDNPMGW